MLALTFTTRAAGELRGRLRGLGVHTVRLAGELPCTLIAEGVETLDEARCLAAMGISLQQGYVYARPGFESLPAPDPSVRARLLAA